jgi:16S rRNA (cytidine1402-2'-O)-methyltransferase
MASGATSDENPAFLFAGFPPARSGLRQKWLKRWCAVPAPVVLFESPHKLSATLADLLTVCGAARRLTIARELTKRFEQVATLALGDAVEWLAADPHRGQGEFVLIVHEAVDAEDEGEAEAATGRWLDALLESVSVRDAARIAARATGQSRDVLYAQALARRKPA